MDELKSWKRVWSRWFRARNFWKRSSASNYSSITRICDTEAERQKAEIDAAARRIFRSITEQWVELHEEFDRIDKAEHDRKEKEAA